MKRPISFGAFAAAAWLLCGVLPFYALTRAQDPAGGGGGPVSNVNGNMNAGGNANANGNANVGGNTTVNAGGSTSMNAGGPTMTNVNLAPTSNTNSARGGGGAGQAAAEEGAEAEAPAAFSGEWVEVGSLWGNAARSPLVLRAGPGAGSQIVGRVKVEEGEGVAILEAAGDRLRVKLEANAGQGGARRVDAEGWVEWGAVVPASEALVVEAASGEVLRRVPLDDGITSVLFTHGGEKAVFHGATAQSLYEAGADDFKLRRALRLDGAVAVGELFFQPASGRLFLPVWRAADGAGGDYTLDFVRAGEGPAAAVSTGLSSAGGGRFLVSDDGQTGYAIHVGGAAWGGAGRLVASVFDLQTLTQVRGFVLPDPVTTDDDIALARGGAELLLLSSQQPQRLLVVEGTGGSLVREIPLAAGVGGAVGFSQTGGAAGPLVASYAEAAGDDSVGLGRARLGPDGKLSPLPEGVAFLAEAGGARYGVDEHGTRVFTLDDAGRVRSSRPIRSAGGKPAPAAPEGEARGVRGLFLTPDNKRLVIIKGFEGCGC